MTTSYSKPRVYVSLFGGQEGDRSEVYGELLETLAKLGYLLAEGSRGDGYSEHFRFAVIEEELPK